MASIGLLVSSLPVKAWVTPASAARRSDTVLASLISPPTTELAQRPDPLDSNT